MKVFCCQQMRFLDKEMNHDLLKNERDKSRESWLKSRKKEREEHVVHIQSLDTKRLKCMIPFALDLLFFPFFFHLFLLKLVLIKHACFMPWFERNINMKIPLLFVQVNMKNFVRINKTWRDEERAHCSSSSSSSAVCVLNKLLKDS